LKTSWSQNGPRKDVESTARQPLLAYKPACGYGTSGVPGAFPVCLVLFEYLIKDVVDDFLGKISHYGNLSVV
jgi:hypothetical protein